MHISRFWLGLVVGVAVGILAARWLTLMLDESVAVPPVLGDGTSVSPILSLEKSPPAESAGAAHAKDSNLSAEKDAEQRHARPAVATAQDRELPSTQRELQSNRRKVAQARTSSSSPIAVPEALKDILTDVPDIERPMSIQEAHRAVSAQSKDENWAYALEQNIRLFFANHPQGPTFDIWLVECRESFCELQGGNFATNREEIVKQVMIELQQQPWIGSVTQTWSSSSSSDGILYFAYIMNWGERNRQSTP